MVKLPQKDGRSPDNSLLEAESVRRRTSDAKEAGKLPSKRLSLRSSTSSFVRLPTLSGICSRGPCGTEGQDAPRKGGVWAYVNVLVVWNVRSRNCSAFAVRTLRPRGDVKGIKSSDCHW